MLDNVVLVPPESAIPTRVPPLFGFASHLGHHRVLSRVPVLLQQALISYVFYI